MADAPPPPLVAVLAAGRASRFGGGKLDAECAGRAVGQWVLDAVAAAGLAPGVIVVSDEAPQFARAASGWTLIVNKAAGQGLGGSLALAAGAARKSARGLLVVLADMPLVTPAYLRMLAAAPRPAATRQPHGGPGVPACFAAAQLGALAELSGDAGAAPLLRAMPGLTTLDPPAGMLADIDRPADLAAAAARLSARG